MNSTAKTTTLAVSVVVLAVAIFNMLGWPVKVRFTEPSLNYWAAFALAAALPFSLAGIGFVAQPKVRKVVFSVAAACAVLPCGICAFFAQSEAIDIEEKGVDLTHVLLGEITMGPNTMRLYRTDCGATCSYGLELCEEVDTPVGIKIVRLVWSKYRTARNAQLRSLGPRHIQVIEDGGVISDVRL